MDETLEINLVINLLELTFRSVKDQDRVSAEIELNKLANKTVEMANTLLKIIAGEHVNGILFISSDIKAFF